MVAFVALTTGAGGLKCCGPESTTGTVRTRHVHVREKKRDTSTEFTLREVDLHPQLLKVMVEWFGQHPGGQYAITVAGEPLSKDTATFYFKQTLQNHEKWARVRGLHTLRHSVASILASKGVDQRYIDKIIGHHTEAMRKRYQHLFPKGASLAINSLLG